MSPSPTRSCAVRWRAASRPRPSTSMVGVMSARARAPAKGATSTGSPSTTNATSVVEDLARIRNHPLVNKSIPIPRLHLRCEERSPRFGPAVPPAPVTPRARPPLPEPKRDQRVCKASASMRRASWACRTRRQRRASARGIMRTRATLRRSAMAAALASCFGSVDRRCAPYSCRRVVRRDPDHRRDGTLHGRAPAQPAMPVRHLSHGRRQRGSGS